MFSEEREMWKKFFDMFKKHFNEEVGLVPSVYDSDDLDIDFIVGENSGALFGVQVIQLFPEGELDEEEEEEDTDDDEDGDEDDEDGPSGYKVEYRFVKTDKKVEDIKEKKQLTLEFEMESDGEDKEQIQLDLFGTEEEFTDLVVYIDKSLIGVYLEHEDFDF